GWEATDQAGSRLAIRRANFAFQAVAIAADTTAVSLRFRPPAWRWGLALSGVGLVIGLGWLWRRSSDKRTSPIP
ncbi:MAG: hypothetical protein WAV66_22225, partial [Anaerolineae bacterium]